MERKQAAELVAKLINATIGCHEREVGTEGYQQWFDSYKERKHNVIEAMCQPLAPSEATREDATRLVRALATAAWKLGKGAWRYDDDPPLVESFRDLARRAINAICWQMEVAAPYYKFSVVLRKALCRLERRLP